jgi:hypothetical protein
MNDEYLTGKLKEYIDLKVEKEQPFTLYDLYTDNKDNFWNFSAIIFGLYISENAEDLGIKEFSKGSFEMTEYKVDDNE